jgi:hypothetical protein
VFVGIVLAAGRPSWFAALWIALGTVWMVSRLRRTRRIWSLPRSPAVDAVARSTSFELTDDERSVFGVRQIGDQVVIGPGRNRLMVSIAVPGAVAFGALWFATSGPAPLAVVLALVLTGAALATAAAFRREAVTLTPEALTVQGRIGDPRSFPWYDVVDIVVDARDGHDAGVLHVVGEPAIDLPTIVADDVTERIALITRYRMTVHAR